MKLYFLLFESVQGPEEGVANISKSFVPVLS